MRRVSLFYGFLSLLNVWLYRRQLYSHISLCIRSLVYHMSWHLWKTLLQPHERSGGKGKQGLSIPIKIVLASWTHERVLGTRTGTLDHT